MRIVPKPQVPASARLARTASGLPHAGEQTHFARIVPDVPHFRWSRGCRLLGRTATGRATILALGMNRPAVIAIRRALVKLGRLSLGTRVE